MENKLEKYGNAYAKFCLEGGSGVFDYGDPGIPKDDEELMKAFEEATTATSKFEQMLELRIEQNGGDYEDFMA